METLRTNLLHDRNVSGIVLNTRDISERKAFEEQLSHQAFHDSVTNLANRALFRDRVTHAIERQDRDRKPVAVLFMDLDDFKTINDSLGHAAGDQLLREVGERLKECLRAADTAARLGGDEFAILLEDGGDGIQAVDVADRVMQALEAPFVLEGKEVFIRAAIGIAVASQGAEVPRRRGAAAQRRRRDVHGEGEGQGPLPGVRARDARHRVEAPGAQGRPAARARARRVQPATTSRSSSSRAGKITGVEALIRWIHPDARPGAAAGLHPARRGDRPDRPDRSMGAARGVLATRWSSRSAYPMEPPFHMAVNLSARQIARPELVDEVRDILLEHRPGALDA